MSAAPPNAPTTTASPVLRHTLILIRGILGAAIGGVLGYFAFGWLARAGLYGIMVPGLLLGLGAGLVARGSSQALGILCALAAIVLAVFTEWKAFPFVKDGSFSFFLSHLHQLPAVKLVMMGLGALAAYWFGQGR